MIRSVRRSALLMIAVLCGGTAFQSAACTADVFRAFAENLDPTETDQSQDFGDWLADQVDEI